jgi:drug/metabolite transporter (DMT)-like permease
LFALGIVATALPIQFMLKGLKHISSMRVATISVLEPIITVLVGIFWLNESVSLLQILGACLTLSSVGLMQFQQEL